MKAEKINKVNDLSLKRAKGLCGQNGYSLFNQMEQIYHFLPQEWLQMGVQLPPVPKIEQQQLFGQQILDYFQQSGYLIQGVIYLNPFIISIKYRMSLLGQQGGRTSNDKSIKESLLNQQISKLREIYQDSSTASEKVLAALKKIMNFNRESTNDDVATLNIFMEDLSSIEDSFITLIENCEADKEQFVSSVIFRDSDKQLTTDFFKKMMKSHQDFKERLNLSILRLQKDIQMLETNGFHIYSTALKPNNVLSSLKKHALDKFIVSLSEMHIVFHKMKAQMSNRLHVDKKSIRTEFKNQIQKIKQYCKIAQQICLKEKMRNMMMSEEINAINLKVTGETKKAKLLEQSIKMNKKCIRSTNNQIMVQRRGGDYIKDSFLEYMKVLKQSTDAHMMHTPKLYKTPAMRSKSCHTLITTQERSKEVKQSEQSAIQSQITIIGGDFLEESMQN